MNSLLTLILQTTYGRCDMTIPSPAGLGNWQSCRHCAKHKFIQCLLYPPLWSTCTVDIVRQRDRLGFNVVFCRRSLMATRVRCSLTSTPHKADQDANMCCESLILPPSLCLSQASFSPQFRACAFATTVTIRLPPPPSGKPYDSFMCFVCIVGPSLCVGVGMLTRIRL